MGMSPCCGRPSDTGNWKPRLEGWVCLFFLKYMLWFNQCCYWSWKCSQALKVYCHSGFFWLSKCLEKKKTQTMLWRFILLQNKTKIHQFQHMQPITNLITCAVHPFTLLSVYFRARGRGLCAQRSAPAQHTFPLSRAPRIKASDWNHLLDQRILYSFCDC